QRRPGRFGLAADGFARAFVAGMLAHPLERRGRPVARPMDRTVAGHPLARVRLPKMRHARTHNAGCRAALHDLTQMLVYEAMREAPLRTETITTPVADTDGYKLAEPPLLVPVLRAGLGMADQAHRMIPEALMGFVGLARDEETLMPTP